MIVVDTNVIASLYLPTDLTPPAEELLRRDPEWAAPALWRSELRNVLALYLRKGLLGFDRAYAIQSEAEELLAGREYDVDSYQVLSFAEQSGRSAYDCEFVALADHLGVRLATGDQELLRAFPDIAVSPNEAAR